MKIIKITLHNALFVHSDTGLCNYYLTEDKIMSSHSGMAFPVIILRFFEVYENRCGIMKSLL